MGASIKYGVNNHTCYGCTERHVGCHGSCEKYLAKAAKNKEVIVARTQYLKEWRDYNVARSKPMSKPR